MNSERYTGKVAATAIPRTQKEEEYLIALRVDYEEEEWEFPGGKEEYDNDGNPEGLKKTAEREIKEELGLEIEAEEVAEDYSWTVGDLEIVPVRSSHDYENADNHLKPKEEKHGKSRWIDPQNHDESLGKERRCLEAFDLR